MNQNVHLLVLCGINFSFVFYSFWLICLTRLFYQQSILSHHIPILCIPFQLNSKEYFLSLGFFLKKNAKCGNSLLRVKIFLSQISSEFIFVFFCLRPSVFCWDIWSSFSSFHRTYFWHYFNSYTYQNYYLPGIFFDIYIHFDPISL